MTAKGDIAGGAPTLSVIIPMYNEAARIERTLRDVLATLPELAFTSELLVVDDGSRDRSAEIVVGVLAEEERRGRLIRASLISHPRNRGKGAAVRTGMAAAAGDWMLFMDADNAVEVREAARLLDMAQRSHAALVIGSRRVPGAEVEARAHRKLAGALFRAGLRAMGMPLARDTQCGFKLYARPVAELVVRHGREDGFAFDIEHLALARRAGVDWIETGVRWTHQPGGTVSPVRDGVRMLAQVASIRRRLRGVSIEPLDLRPPPEVVVRPGTMGRSPVGRGAT